MKRFRRSRNEHPGDARAIVDLMKSSGFLFSETDEQMAAYEANVKLRDLPDKFRTPEFVFKAAQTKTE